MNKKYTLLSTLIIASLLIIMLVISSGQATTSTTDPIEQLKIQNKKYQTALSNDGDISPELRTELVQNGQSPHAVVLTCSDSRVVPEHIFMSGLGEIFTIRNAGNIVNDTVLGSVEYGVSHLDAQVIVVLGHTHCGAVEATIADGGHSYISTITDEIESCIHDEQDASKAEILNVEHSIQELSKSEVISQLIKEEKLQLVGAIYDAETGKVTFLEDTESYADEETIIETSYNNSVFDAMVAEDNEIQPLVTLTKSDNMTTWNNEDEVLLVTWHKYPDSYIDGETTNLEFGDVWTFTDKEITAWYEENKDSIHDYNLRFKQLIGLPELTKNTHFTAMWVDPEDVIRPAYDTDITKDNMTNNYSENITEEDIEWFNDNIINSYYAEYQYPWTRLGYTYDWSGNGSEYGLSEFLVKQNSDVDVEFTLTTEEFMTYMDKEIQK